MKRHQTLEILILGMKSERPKKQRKAKEILGEGCGGLDGGEHLDSGTNSRRSAEV